MISFKGISQLLFMNKMRILCISQYVSLCVLAAACLSYFIYLFKYISFIYIMCFVVLLLHLPTLPH
jgi:hypothetical protein